jgi:hypothetical protein
MTLIEIQEFLKDSLTAEKPALKITKNSGASFEVTGTIEAMQGKKKWMVCILQALFLSQKIFAYTSSLFTPMLMSLKVFLRRYEKC